MEELAVYFKGFQHLKKHFADLVQVLEKLRTPQATSCLEEGPGHMCAPCLAIVLPYTFLSRSVCSTCLAAVVSGGRLPLLHQPLAAVVLLCLVDSGAPESSDSADLCSGW